VATNIELPIKNKLSRPPFATGAAEKGVFYANYHQKEINCSIALSRPRLQRGRSRKAFFTPTNILIKQTVFFA
jgi:hypothetical protein